MGLFDRALNAIYPARKRDAGKVAQPPPMTPRQRELNRLWSLYCACPYDARKIGWDGTPHLSGVSREDAAAAMVDPGAAHDEVPLRLRRPVVTIPIQRLTVNRFTQSLFSADMHPRFKVEGDPKTEDWLAGFAESSRLWARMAYGRRYGGALGTAIFGLFVRDGRFHIEVFDPRWTTPTWADRRAFIPKSIEEKYPVKKTVLDPDGVPVEQWYWRRREIDATGDKTFVDEPIPEDPATPIDWKVDADQTVEYALDFCPVVWVQNLPGAVGEIDGERDCHGLDDLAEAVDALYSQRYLGVQNNMDPTLVLKTDRKLPKEVLRGNGQVISVEAGGGAGLMEAQGSGFVTAQSLGEDCLERYMEAAQLVLTHGAAAGRTATEIERVYESMWARVGEFREQYGEQGIKRLAAMAIRLALVIAERGERVVLPPKVETNDEGEVTGRRERQLGPDALDDGNVEIELDWPHFTKPSVEDIAHAVTAAAGAKAAGVLDLDHLTRFLAPYFGVENPKALAVALAKSAAEAEENMAAQMIKPPAAPPKQLGAGDEAPEAPDEDEAA